MKPTEKDFAEIRALAQQHQALVRKFREDHQDEIDALRWEAEAPGKAFWKETRRQMREAQKLRQREAEDRHEQRREHLNPRPEPEPNPAPSPKPPAR